MLNNESIRRTTLHEPNTSGGIGHDQQIHPNPAAQKKRVRCISAKQLAAVPDADGSHRVCDYLQVCRLSGSAHRLYELQARQGLRREPLGWLGNLRKGFPRQGFPPGLAQLPRVQLRRSADRHARPDHSGADAQRAAVQQVQARVADHPVSATLPVLGHHRLRGAEPVQARNRSGQHPAQRMGRHRQGHPLPVGKNTLGVHLSCPGRMAEHGLGLHHLPGCHHRHRRRAV